MSGSSSRYTFLATHRDDEACIVRNFYLFYYTEDTTISLHDIDRKRVFLKRILIDNVSINQLHIGAKVMILSRQFTIRDYGDEYTRKHLELLKQKTFVLLKPEVVNKYGEILDLIIQNGFYISEMKMVQLERSHALELYKKHSGSEFMPFLIEHITSGPCLALELIAEKGIGQFRKMLGPIDPEKARQEFKETLRAKFGTDKIKNALHASSSLNEAERELKIFFLKSAALNEMIPETSAILNNSVLCLIKSHAIREGCLGKIISDLQMNDFYITAMQMFSLELQDARQFFEAYENVIPEYVEMVNEITHGPCVAIELKHKTGDPQANLKELLGPRDPATAKFLFPDSIRAKYGKNKVMNAVHCTDLEEDVMLELEFFFVILQKK